MKGAQPRGQRKPEDTRLPPQLFNGDEEAGPARPTKELCVTKGGNAGTGREADGHFLEGEAVEVKRGKGVGNGGVKGKIKGTGAPSEGSMSPTPGGKLDQVLIRLRTKFLLAREREKEPTPEEPPPG